MSRQQGPKPPQAPPLQPQQQWRPQAEHDATARAMAAAAQGWQQPPAAQQPHPGHPQYQPQYAAPLQAAAAPAYGYPPQSHLQPPAQHQPPQHPHSQHQHPSAPPQLNPQAHQRHPAPLPPQQPGGYQPPVARDAGGLDAYGVQIGQSAQPRTAPPAQPRFAEPPNRAQSQHFQAPPPPPGAGFRADPGSYDLGGYAVPASGPPGRFPPAQQEQPAYFGREPAAQAFPPPGQQPGQHAPQHTAQHLGQHPGAAHYDDTFGSPQPNLPADQHHAQDDLEYEEEPRRSRRWMIAAALVCSIGIGGGMAYAYKSIFSPTKGPQTAVVKAAREPAKVAPESTGGKRFPNTDSKFMNRLDGDAASDSDAGGVKRVQTVAVGPDRGLVAPPPGASSAPRPVPGMTIVGADALNPSGGGLPPGMSAPGLPPARSIAQPAPAAGGAAAAARPAPPVASPPPQRAQVVAKAPPQGVGAIDGDPTAAKQAVPRAAAVAPKKSGGYVAVLGYQRSQLDAMKMLADLQQKFDVLRDRKLQVVESDQSARGLGTIYRVVVGPSGALADAKSVCTQVVAAGHPAKDCYTLGN